MAFYPQLLSWDLDTDGDVETAISTTTTSPTTTSVVTKLKHKEDTENASLKIGSSFKDTAEFISLIAQLNNTFKSLWSQEEVKRKKEQQTEANRVVNKQDKEDNGTMIVNIWRNVDGKLKLTGNEK